MLNALRIFAIFFLMVTLSVLSEETSPSPDSIYAHIEHLCVTIGPRTLGSVAETRALHWAAQKFEDYGADSIFVMTFSKGQGQGSRLNTQSGVTVGIFRGETDSSIVIGGHIDSDGREVPGANDNASGTAATIELARIWSVRPRHYTMIFSLFGGEERGLHGSKYFISHFPDTASIQLMFSLDMCGADDFIETLPEYKNFQAPKWLIKDSFDADRRLGINRLRYPTHFSALNNIGEGGAGSDHMSFLEKGIPAIDFTVGTTHSPIHSPQDDLQHIHKPMLKHYSRFIDTILLKYQSEGIPETDKKSYVFWNPFGLMLFFPKWSLWALVGLSVLCALLTFLKSRKNRLRILKEDRIRWTGWKLVAFGVIVTAVARSGSFFMGLSSGHRIPWFVHPLPYAWFMLPLGIFGVWITSQLSRRWSFSPDQYVYIKRALIILTALTVLSCMGNVTLAAHFALTLLLLCLSFLIRPVILQVSFALLALLPIFRLIFNEAYTFMARGSAFAGIWANTIFKAVLFETVLSLILMILLLPATFQLASIVASSGRLPSVVRNFRKVIPGVVFLSLTIGYGFYLSGLESFNATWRPFVRVYANYHMQDKKSDITITGTDYLTGIEVTTDSLHKELGWRKMKTEIPATFNADWINVCGVETVQTAEKDTVTLTETVGMTVEWVLSTIRPWYQVQFFIWADSLTIDSVCTDLNYNFDEGRVSMSWFADPPDSIRVKARIKMDKGLNLVRKVRAVYPELPIKMDVKADSSNIRYRTIVTWQDTVQVVVQDSYHEGK